MMGNSLLTQVLVAGLAIGIIITYIQPTFAEVKTRQDEIAKTQEELQRVKEVNDRLNNLYQRLNAISQQDKAALLVYLPDQVDEVQVLKDLSLLTEEANVLVKNISYMGAGQRAADATESDPFPHSFSVTFESSYEAMKNLLLLLERNNYPLVVESLSVSPTEGGFLSVDLSLITYSSNEEESL